MKITCRNCGWDVTNYIRAKKPVAFSFTEDGVYAHVYCRCGHRLKTQKVDKETAYEYLRRWGI